ncbi:phosphonatase-like hydrolase [Streptomyces sp. ISL-111]|uniref:phosphonatase-like hydrolase n=1 Tax=unclassified Streptomyces TaxID=2593676 RepID=UPI001BE56255|nr:MULTISPECIES: phosphonatase-like hydrolase [unclassified Streptomyces]MBT2380351.1 phosphonatase-like hydrolase [Streptomyces sp. ISL-111]MBT2427066.1 phosphonatase-like hydrolase [Streptomyces sp. ISL-112]MBT2466150.1 phosphonatase-like hydrolase [Streptomyces sp. ISL-63]
MTSAEQATEATGRNPYRLVVLDMAGTTVADGGLVEQAFSAAAERLGVKPGSGERERQLAHVRATMGESKISVFRHLFGDEEKAEYANAAFEEAYGELVDGGRIAPIPGAREAVERLTAEGRTVVLTTGFARTTQDAILAALGWQDLVPLALCPADAGGRGRPYPDMVLAAFLRTGAVDDVRRIVVAGDTSYDMLSGQRSGAGLVAGVLTGAHDAGQLERNGATHVLGSVAELPDLIARAEA